MSGAGTLIPGLVARVAIGFALALAVGTKGWRGKGGLEWFRQRQTYLPLILAGFGLSIFLMWLYLEQHGVVRSEPGFSFYVDVPPLFGLILFALGILRSYRAAPTLPRKIGLDHPHPRLALRSLDQRRSRLRRSPRRSPRRHHLSR